MERPENILRLIKQRATRVDTLSADASWIDNTLEQLGAAQFVLIGESTHGTHDFYRMRAEITKRLISDKGFSAVAVEADWPDAYRVNKYVRGENDDSDSEIALTGFKRFPTWMWRNADVLDFVGWLRSHNDALSSSGSKPKVGFYGLDLYSLYTSMEVVIHYLDKVDPEAAALARERYGCFDLFGRDAQVYARAAGSGMSETCETEVITQLLDLQQSALGYLRRDGVRAESELFDILQNARVVKNAEEYYRTMLHGRISSWNLRDTHMVETLDLLKSHLEKTVKHPKIVVWAHNSHLGDARATQMGEYGEWNVGELIRKRYREKAFLLGFTTYSGTVTAASGWDAPAERKRVRPALPDSYEALFHQSEIPRFILNFREDDFLKHILGEPRLERAIGVLYLPETERQSHYFHARISDQFDAVFHIDETRAVEPLEKTSEWKSGEAPETYPSAV